MEQQLSDSRWLAGQQQPTIADVACYPYTAMAEQGGLSLKNYTSVNRWLNDIKSLPGYIALPD